MSHNTTETLRHGAYSVVAPNQDVYQGRPRINSKRESVQGGVFYPPVLAGKMEAITVDYEVDMPLKAYIDEVEQHIVRLAESFRKTNRNLPLAVVLSTISHKIAADFPYSTRMTDETYASKTYTPGTKYRLSCFMENQDMVCRHMGLLVGAILDHLKENSRQRKSPGIRAETEVRFMAETQEDLLELKSGGHGYVVVKRGEPGSNKNLYYVIDPTGGRAVEIRDCLKSKREKGPGVYRYLFSVLRFLFQKEDRRDTAFLDEIFETAKKDSTMLGVLRDVRKTLQEVDPVRHFDAHRLKANLGNL